MSQLITIYSYGQSMVYYSIPPSAGSVPRTGLWYMTPKTYLLTPLIQTADHRPNFSLCRKECLQMPSYDPISSTSLS